MAEPRRTGVLHLTPSSVLRAVVLLGFTMAALTMVAASARVIGWILAASVLAGLLHPAVQGLGRRIPRGLALAVVVLLSLAATAGVAYVVVDDVNQQLRELQRAVPDAARELERSERFGEAAREAKFAEKAEAFVDELPQRLRGGNVQDALRSAATRGVAFLATGVLTIFFLIHGPKLLRAAISQLPEARRAGTTRVGLAIYERTWHYVIGTLGMAFMAGLVAYACASVIDTPGKAPLALWIALLDVIPLLGILIGGMPLILLAATTSSWQGTVAVSAVLIAWQVFEAAVLQRRVEERSVHIGPFVTVAVAMVGLELYGIGGALVSLVAVVLVAAVADEVVGHGPRSSAHSLASRR